MRDVLCIYYSRTGNTKRVMETIAKEMDAELLALTDGVERSGLRGWLRSGMDAMRKDCPDEHRSEDIYRQMDQYTGKPHQAATSLRVGHVGHTFWQEEFLRQIRELLAEEE